MIIQTGGLSLPHEDIFYKAAPLPCSFLLLQKLSWPGASANNITIQLVLSRMNRVDGRRTKNCSLAVPVVAIR